MKKIKKFIKTPGIFFRDYLNKKYPIINSEQQYIETDESILIENDLKLISLESNLVKKSMPVDVVFTWVDNKDPVWQKKYQSTNFSQISEGLYSSDSARFTNHNELYYSIYSIQKFMPWIDNIYVITDGQTPTWLESKQNNIFDTKKIKIIDHSEIIDRIYLPTFNSHVIEAHLHKIPNLSENFIYFNDDVFVARPLQVEHFFRANGIVSIFIANKKLSIMQRKGVITPTLAASLNSVKLLQRNYNIFIDNSLVHTYVPLKKSIYEKAWQLYEKEIKAFLPNQLRTNNDLNMANFLVPWLTYLEGKSVFTREICYYFNIRSAYALTQYSKLLLNKRINKQPHSFCANDFNSTKSIPNYQEKLDSMLRDYYQL